MEIEIIPVTESPGKYIIYKPRTGLAFIGNHAMANITQRLADSPKDQIDMSPDMDDFLQSIGFYLPDPPEPPRREDNFLPTTAVLLMTNQCQLRCTYCYAAAGEAPPEELTLELGYTAIDAVCKNAEDTGRTAFEVSFHGGGEPTFNWHVLKACAEYAREKPLLARLTLTSNGIWSPRQCDWIVNNLDGLSLSLDGSPETQDNQRPLLLGGRSSELVMRTVAELDRREFAYSIRMTATAPWERLPQDMRYLCENTGCRNFQVEPAFNTERGGHGDTDTDDGMAFVRAYLEAHDIATQHGRNLMYSGARLGQVTTTFCTAPYNALIVNGGGAIVTCYEVASPAHPLSSISTIGCINDSAIAINTDARSSLHNLMAERRDACRDCFCYWSCAGDCYARVFADEPDGHQIRGVRCQMNRTLTEQLLLRRMAEGNGVWQKSASASVPLNGMEMEISS